MEAKTIDRLKPEYRAGLRQLDATLGAMKNDSLVSARRIREPIRETGDINDAFDAITYQKGAGVLAMFENWIGEDKFRDGIRLFLKRHARGTATSDDLIAALTEASGRGAQLSKAMRGFLDQAGIPLVTTQLECSKDKARITLSQSRYFPLGSKGKQGASWKVPVCLKLSSKGVGSRECMLLEQPQQSFDLGSCPDWYLPNAAGAGYYRYRLPAKDLAALNQHVAQLAPAEQMIHADAISAGFHRGDLAPDTVLKALPQFASSSLSSVALFPLADFNWILGHLADAAGSKSLRDYASTLYQPQLERLGYTTRADESQDDTLLRQSLVDFLALDARSAPVREAMADLGKKLFRESGSGPLELDDIDSNILGSVLAVQAQEGGAPVMQRLMAELKTNRNPQQRLALLEALGAIDQPELAQQVRTFALEGGLQMRELATLYRAHQRQPANRAGYWTWMQANFDRVLAPYPDFAQNRIPAIAARHMCSVKDATQLEKFFKPRLSKIAGGKRALAQALEGVQVCATLKGKNSGAEIQRSFTQLAMPATP